MKGNNKAFLALVWISFFWGTTYVASKIATQEIPGLFLSAVRLFVSGILITGWFLLRGSKLPDKKILAILFVQSIFLLIFGNGLSTWGIQYISGGLASIISALIPLEIVLFSILIIRKTKITLLLFAGLLAGLAGLYIIFHEYLNELLQPQYTFGVILSLCAGVMWSIGSVLTTKYKLSIDLLFGAGIQMLFAGIVLLPISILSGHSMNLLHAQTDSILSLIYLIIIGSVISYSLFIYANSKLSAARVSIYAYINPIVAILLGWMILREKLNIYIIIGTVITLAGVYVVNNEFRKQVLK
ncbi:MAG: EamA family transporter [Fimbriimonadaceae bacterium]|nr:EamA family transporter [Chitinophagales bacterium]